LLDFLCELQYDSRIHEHQIKIVFMKKLGANWSQAMFAITGCRIFLFQFVF